MKSYTFAMLVNNVPGVLTRISGLFTRRGFNIDTLTVGKTHQDNRSRLTMTFNGSEADYEQLTKQLGKLIDVIKISELPFESSIIKELCFVKLAIANDQSRKDILDYSKVYNNKVVNLTPNSATVQIVGHQNEVASFLDLVKPFGIKEIVRTGMCGISREY